MMGNAEIGACCSHTKKGAKMLFGQKKRWMTMGRMAKEASECKCECECEFEWDASNEISRTDPVESINYVISVQYECAHGRREGKRGTARKEEEKEGRKRKEKEKERRGRKRKKEEGRGRNSEQEIRSMDGRACRWSVMSVIWSFVWMPRTRCVLSRKRAKNAKKDKSVERKDHFLLFLLVRSYFGRRFGNFWDERQAGVRCEWRCSRISSRPVCRARPEKK